MKCDGLGSIGSEECQTACSCPQREEAWNSKKVGEIIEELSDYQLFKRASTPNTYC
jgi:hypothetical protein